MSTWKKYKKQPVEDVTAENEEQESLTLYSSGIMFQTISM
jgi:hypothetical protein